MKIKFQVLLIASISFLPGDFLFAQDAKEILRKAYESHMSIKEGYYEKTMLMKYMTKNDTSVRGERTWFKKLRKDPCFGFAFHQNRWYNNKYDGYNVYTGNELVSGSDTSGTIYNVNIWKDEINKFKHNYKTYTPFTDPDKSLLTPKEINEKGTVATINGEELHIGMPCYVVAVEEVPENEPGEMMKVTGLLSRYWISKDKYYVLQYEKTIHLVMGKDSMVQYERHALDTFNVSSPISSDLLSLKVFPDTYIFKEYSAHKEIPLLDKETLAPDWHSRP